MFIDMIGKEGAHILTMQDWTRRGGEILNQLCPSGQLEVVSSQLVNPSIVGTFLPSASDAALPLWPAGSDWYSESPDTSMTTEDYGLTPWRPNERHLSLPALESGPQQMLMVRDDNSGVRFQEQLTSYVAPNAIVDNVPSLIDTSSTGRISCPNRPCRETFVGRWELERHLQFTCMSDPVALARKKVKCISCTKTYSRKDAMLRHYKECHA